MYVNYRLKRKSDLIKGRNSDSFFNFILNEYYSKLPSTLFNVAIVVKADENSSDKHIASVINHSEEMFEWDEESDIFNHTVYTTPPMKDEILAYTRCTEFLNMLYEGVN